MKVTQCDLCKKGLTPDAMEGGKATLETETNTRHERWKIVVTMTHETVGSGANFSINPQAPDICRECLGQLVAGKDPSAPVTRAGG